MEKGDERKEEALTEEGSWRGDGKREGKKKEDRENRRAR